MELEVMLIDDEYIILDGLESFPWNEYNCNVVAVAKNGIEGMKELEKIKPDFILSDIKMPGMDGLEFAKKAKEKYPDVVIVLLTGYDSFDYAKQAISIGVKEYLLKPIDYEEMKSKMKQITDEIRESKQQENYYEQLQKAFRLAIPQLREKFVSNLVHGRISSKADLEIQEKALGISIEKYAICMGKRVGVGSISDTTDGLIEEFSYTNILQKKFEEAGLEVLSEFNTVTMEYTFMILFSSEKDDGECIDLVDQACKKAQKEIEQHYHTFINFGISNVSCDSYCINQQYRNAQKTCRQCNYLGKNVILRYDDIISLDQKDFILTSGEKDHLMMTLFQGEFMDVVDGLQYMFTRAPDYDSAKFAAMDLLVSCMKFPYTCVVQSDIQDKNWDVSVLQDGIKGIADCNTVEEIVMCLLKNFSMLIKQNTRSTDERNRTLVKSIQAYIEKNYASDLSMDDLTEYFHVSRTYISRLLKKYSKQSFLEYLTDVRFKKVEQLMINTQYKQHEIAEMVGYRDFSYYIKVFKKRYGITPNEYRRKI